MSEATKARIMGAAAQDIRERGLKFTMEAVAARLGMSKKTLYQYYSSKDELIAALVEKVVQDLELQSREIVESDRDLASRLIDIVTLEPKVFGPIPDWIRDEFRRFRPQDWEQVEAFRRKEAERLVQLLEEGMAGGDIRLLSAPLAVQVLHLACSGIMDYEFLRANNLTFSDGMRQIKEIFLYGVLRKKETQENEAR